MVLGDATDGAIILAIIATSGPRLLAGVPRWCAVDALPPGAGARRGPPDGREVVVPADDVVAGDVVVLRAGDIVPADCRVIARTVCWSTRRR